MDETNIRILIVEDDIIIRVMFRTTLLNEINNVCIEEACSQETALRKFEEFKPNLVFMDIELVGSSNGIDTAKKIRREHSKVPIIFTTSSPELLTPEIIKQVYPSGVMSKPVNHKMLKPVIYMALAN